MIFGRFGTHFGRIRFNQQGVFTFNSKYRRSVASINEKIPFADESVSATSADISNDLLITQSCNQYVNPFSVETAARCFESVLLDTESISCAILSGVGPLFVVNIISKLVYSWMKSSQFNASSVVLQKYDLKITEMEKSDVTNTKNLSAWEYIFDFLPWCYKEIVIISSRIFPFFLIRWFVTSIDLEAIKPYSILWMDNLLSPDPYFIMPSIYIGLLNLALYKHIKYKTVLVPLNFLLMLLLSSQSGLFHIYLAIHAILLKVVEKLFSSEYFYRLSGYKLTQLESDLRNSDVNINLKLGRINYIQHQRDYEEALEELTKLSAKK